MKVLPCWFALLVAPLDAWSADPPEGEPVVEVLPSERGYATALATVPPARRYLRPGPWNRPEVPHIHPVDPVVRTPYDGHELTDPVGGYFRLLWWRVGNDHVPVSR